MAIPLLIDTDMGVDDAVAIALALASPEFEVRGIVSTGGNVDLEQATRNVARVLSALRPARRPRMGKGLDQTESGLVDARHVFGKDGLGECGVPDASPKAGSYLDVYRHALEGANDGVIVAIGPLTTLAAMLKEDPATVRRARRIVVMGGALWCAGNIAGVSEFNFYRDPAAAEAVLSAGLPVTLVPLDVTRNVTLDESNAAHLAASGTPAGEFLAKIIAYPLQHSTEAGSGRFAVHDALAVGALLWPAMFMKTRLAVEVSQTSKPRGQTHPKIGQRAAAPIDVLTAVSEVDFVENLLERLCQQTFVV